MVGDQLTSSCLVPDQNSVRVCKGEGWPRDPGGKRQRGWTGERERQGRRQTSGQAREGPAGPGRVALWSGGGWGAGDDHSHFEQIENRLEENPETRGRQAPRSVAQEER